MTADDGSEVVEVFKQVARVGTRLLSVYDGRTEYALGVAMRQPLGPLGAAAHGGGGYYCYATFERAAAADVPRASALRVAPRAVLRCRAWGARAPVGRRGKIVVECIEPLELLRMPLGYTTLARRAHWADLGVPPLGGGESVLDARRAGLEAASLDALRPPARRPGSAHARTLTRAAHLLHVTERYALDDDDDDHHHAEDTNRRTARRAPPARRRTHWRSAAEQPDAGWAEHGFDGVGF